MRPGHTIVGFAVCEDEGGLVIEVAPHESSGLGVVDDLTADDPASG